MTNLFGNNMELPHWSEYGYPEDLAIENIMNDPGLHPEIVEELIMEARSSKKRRETFSESLITLKPKTKQPVPHTLKAVPVRIQGLTERDISNEWKWNRCIFYYEKPKKITEDHKKNEKAHKWRRDQRNCYPKKDSIIGIQGGAWRREIKFYNYFEDPVNKHEWNESKKTVQHKSGVILHRVNDNRYLLVQSYGTNWGFPQGTVELEDKSSQPSFCEELLRDHPERELYTQMCTGAVRELREETGMDLSTTISRIISLNRIPFFYSKVEGVELLNPSLIGENNEGYEITGIGWFTLKEMKRLRLNKNTQKYGNKN